MASGTVTGRTGRDIQDAIDGLDGPGTIHLDAGEYRLDRPLKLTDGTSLVGSGPDRTVLVLADGANCHLAINSDPSGGNRDISIRDLTVDGNRARQDLPPKGVAVWSFGVWLRRVHGVRLERVAFRQVRQNGLQLNDCVDVHVARLTATDMGWSGIGATRCSGLVIEETTVDRAGIDTTHSGIHVDGGDGIYVDAEVLACSGNALMVDSVSGPVNGAIVTGRGRRSRCGVSVVASRDHPVFGVVVSGEFSDNEAAGVMVSNARGVTVLHSVLCDNVESGVLLQGQRGCTHCAVLDSRIAGSPVQVRQTGGSTSNLIRGITGGHPAPDGEGQSPRATGSSAATVAGRIRNTLRRRP